jgi:hypothetical protein
MGIVVVQGAVIKCPHGGQLKLLSADSRLTVTDSGVVTSGMEAGLTFGSPQVPVPGMVSPCIAQTPPPPATPFTFVPCVTSAALPVGLATKLTVGGLPALLDSASGPTISGAGPGTWSVSSAGQQKLEAT